MHKIWSSHVCLMFVQCIDLELLFLLLGDPRVFTLKQQDNGAETDSIRTEDFETAFQKSLPAGTAEY